MSPRSSLSRGSHHWGALLPIAGLVAFLVALIILHRALAAYNYRQLLHDLRAIPLSHVSAAMVLTALDYWALTAYDALALRVIRRRLAYAKIGATAFMAFAFSHNLGYAVLSGGAIRWRFYAAWGLAGPDIAAVTLLGGVAFWVGFLIIGGLAFVVWMPPSDAWLTPEQTRLVGVGILVVLSLVIGWALARRRPLRVRHWMLPSPSVPHALLLIGVACLDWLLVACVVWVLLPPVQGIGFVQFVGCFIIAQAAGNISQVPGGLGVVEASLMVMLGGGTATPALAGALLAYRAIYYLLPFVVAMMMLCCIEALRHRGRMQQVTATLGRALRPMMPHVAAALAFVAGAILLISGATPPAGGRIEAMEHWVPLPLVETAHFVGSLCGMALLLLGRGLQLRLRDAWCGSLLLLLLAAACSLLKGLDYEEATIMALFALVIAPLRLYFPRHASLSTPRPSARWTVAIITVLISSFWLSWFCYYHAGYAGCIEWWQVTYKANAPRSLRAGVGAAVLLLAVSLWRLLTPAMPRFAPASPEQLDIARSILASSSDALGNLVLTGDKAVMFDDHHTAFVMYAISGRYWIAMGDPIGAPTAREELAWRFHAIARDKGGVPVFYQIHRDQLPLYLDLGMVLRKLGEEARIELATFALERTRKDLRRSYRKAEQEGCRFAILAGQEVDRVLPRLRAISDAWLAMKGSLEKGFSLGFFSDAYVRSQPVAVVRHHGEIMAFANCWPTTTREELSFDLMRFAPEAPRGVMDFLLVELITWGKVEGYRWFNLGMAPFSGLPDRPHAPLWNRLGSRMFRSGESFYNFRGLREYKEKFYPVWNGRYLACPSGLAQASVLAHLSLLIGGGVRGVLPHTAPVGEPTPAPTSPRSSARGPLDRPAPEAG